MRPERSNMALERAAGSHSLAAAAHRPRSADTSAGSDEAMTTLYCTAQVRESVATNSRASLACSIRLKLGGTDMINWLKSIFSRPQPSGAPEMIRLFRTTDRTL